jgi:YaiO family outer membrane protein
VSRARAGVFHRAGISSPLVSSLFSALVSSAVLGLCSPLTAIAQVETPANSVGLSVGREHLSNGSPDWTETQLQFNHRIAPRHTVGATLTRTERFGLRDSQLGLTYTLPVQKASAITLEANASDTHRVLPQRSIGATAQVEFAPAWLLHAGLKTTSYDTATINQSVWMLERYIGNISASLAWRPAHAYGTTVHAYEARANYYYGERDAVGVILATGREAANIGPAVAITSVDAAALIGRHWFDRQWAASYGISRTRQGDLYTRNGINLGLQYAF